MAETAVEPQQRPGVYAVQFASGGIPQDPHLIEGPYAMALRLFVEVAVANRLEWTDDCSENWIGNDDDEVRLYGPLGIWSELSPPLMSEWKNDQMEERPFDDAELAAVEAILDTIREKNREDQDAREVLAEDSTPDRPGGCD